MKDDRQPSGKRGHPFRYILFSLAALVVLSLGITLIPAGPPAPGPPSAAESARTTALDDTLRLRTAVGHLASRTTVEPAAAASLGDVVTLLTLQARALLLPDEATPQPGSTAGVPEAGSTAGVPEAAPSVPGLAKDLAASGARRLQDAKTTDDGGMARLLAGVGTAQLLAAERLHAGSAGERLQAGAPAAPAAGKEALSAAAAPCASPTAAAAASASAPASRSDAAASVDAATALSAVLLAEREAVYAYEAALSRLVPGTAGPAAAFLGGHRELARDAENRLLLTCRAVPLQQPGYAIDADFLQAPAGRLGSLEAGTLPLYGDLIALSDGGTRDWAVSALHAAAARALQWGADPGPVPGLVLDPAQLPAPEQLPGMTSVSGPAEPGTATQRPQR